MVAVADPSNPAVTGSFHWFPKNALGIDVSNSFAYVTVTLLGLRVLDISNAVNMVEVGYYNTPGTPYAVAISNSYVYVTAGDAGLQIYEHLIYGVDESTYEGHTFCSLQLVQNPVHDGYITLTLQISKKSTICLNLYNILGQKIKTFPQACYSAGCHKLTLPVRDVPPGVYFLKSHTPFSQDALKVIIAK